MHPLTDSLPDYLDALALRQACGEIEAQLREKIEGLQNALCDLVERANTSDDCQYGTLSTSFVRDIAIAALEATK